MPLPGLHPTSRTPSLDSVEQLRQLSLQGEENYTGIFVGEAGKSPGVRVGPRASEVELNELLNLNASIYDLTIQYSCLAAHKCGGSVGFPALISVLILEVLNVFVQMSIVFAVNDLVAVPAKGHAQHLYRLFTNECYEDDDLTYSQDVFDQFGSWDDVVAKSELCQYPLTAPNFFFLILLIWTLYLMHELKQTIYFWWHTMELPKPDSEDGRVTFINNEDNYIITHMGVGLKVWTTLIVFIPKLMIALVLWYIGAGWLTATRGIDNLVLNSLALTFICEVDELMFRTCVSEVAKSCLEKTKLPLPAFKYSPNWWMPIETVSTMLACIGMAYVYMYFVQDAIPDFRFDLTEICVTHDKVSLHSLLKVKE